ncbi:MAG: redoxin family protein [bacterium]|nr:redoxin family protein [bacterium]
MKRTLILVLATLLLLPGAVALPASAAPLDLRDLEGERHDPLDAADRVTVFLFARTDCPISNRYAPEVKRLHAEYAPRDVDFFLVYPDPDEPIDEIRKHMQDYGYEFPALRDPRHELVELSGAVVTPEAALFSAEGKLVYRGRIDDLYVDFGKRRSTPSVRDLKLSLDAVLAGKPVPQATTRAVGCYIPPLD